MTDAVKEQLSACLDGELPRAELDLLLKRLEHDAELRAVMGRYALMREALRQVAPSVASPSFADKVMKAVAAETPVKVPLIRRISPVAVHRLRPVAGLAVAASVAALAVFSVQRSGLLPGGPTVAVNESAPPPTVTIQDESPSYVVPTTTSQPVFVPAARLTNYVVAHSEYSSPLGRRSVLTSVLTSDEDRDDFAPEDEAPSPESPVQVR
ncbi:MAG TPA: sigma-E factor negative regulatory protein [Steroidobacter sp.]